jgi:hypothetical protein
MAVKGGTRFAVTMGQVFPEGCHLVPDSISEAMDYDEETKRRSPAVDKLTSKPVFQVRVVDLDPTWPGGLARSWSRSSLTGCRSHRPGRRSRRWSSRTSP